MKYPPLNVVQVWTDTGETWTTNVASAITEADAVAYFLGQTFNLGVDEDYVVWVNAVRYFGPSTL